MNVRTLTSRTGATVAPGPFLAFIYGRASSDPKKRGRSIKDQFVVAELDCQDIGATIVDYYEDRDRSASRRATKTREDYERLVADVEAGKGNVIVYAERSRANRSMDAFVKLRELCARTSTLLCYGGRLYDMNNPSDRKEATRDALQSEEEAEAIIERAQRTARLNAQRGTPHGRVPFGYVRKYDPDDGHLLGQYPHPVEAAVVRELFERAASREGLLPLTEVLRVHVPEATRGGLRYLLLNKTYIGVRTHNGQDMAECQWPALVDEETFWAVQDVVADPSRRTNRDVTVRHLLTGIATCSVCTAGGSPGKGIGVAKISGRERYICRGLGHVTVRKDWLEASVEASVFSWLGSDAAVALFTKKPDGAEVEKVRRRLRNMEAQLASARERAGQFDDEGNPALTTESLAAMERQLLPQIAKDGERVKSMSAAEDPLLQGLLGCSLESISTAWNDQMDITQRRHVLRKIVNVEIRRASSRGVRWLEPDRIGLTFVGSRHFRPVKS